MADLAVVTADLAEIADTDFLAAWAPGVLPFLSPAARAELEALMSSSAGRAAVTAPLRDDSALQPQDGEKASELYQKYLRLRTAGTTEQVLDWRAKLPAKVQQAVQEVVEKRQAMVASALDKLEFTDDAEAEQVWDIFAEQFPKAAERGFFMTTPTSKADVKYRWRMLKSTLGIDSAAAVDLIEKEAAPLFVDPDFISRSFDAFVLECEGNRVEVLNDIVFKNPGALISDARIVKGNLMSAKISAAAIDFMRVPGRLMRKVLSDNGRRTFINARDEPAFGGGLPALKRRWKLEEDLDKCLQEFKGIDVDGRGTVSREELLAGLGAKVTAEKVDPILANPEVAKDGQVNYKKFIQDLKSAL